MAEVKVQLKASVVRTYTVEATNEKEAVDWLEDNSEQLMEDLADQVEITIIDGEYDAPEEPEKEPDDQEDDVAS